MYYCKTCNKGYEKCTSLAAHISSAHSSIFVCCVICRKEFHPRSIKNHIKTHEKDSFCPSCGKAVKYRNKFCNHSCSAAYTNKVRGKKLHPANIPCKECGKLTRRNVYCSKECKKKHNYDIFINNWLLGNTVGNTGEFGGVSLHIRNWLYKRADNKCEGVLDNGDTCGWARINQTTKKLPLCVHHIDGNSDNNKPENLKLLCPNCHSLTETYGSLNRGKSRRKRR